MSMSALVQFGVGMAASFSILQAKKHLTRNMEQNADIEDLGRLVPKRTPYCDYKFTSFVKWSEGVCDFRIWLGEKGE